MSILLQDAQTVYIHRANNHVEWGYFTVKYFELPFYVPKQNSLNYLTISDQHVILCSFKYFVLKFRKLVNFVV